MCSSDPYTSFFVRCFLHAFCLAALLLASCAERVIAPDVETPSSIELSIRPNPVNAFAAIADVKAGSGHTVVVQFESASSVRQTPLLVVEGDSAHVDLLGMTPGAEYRVSAFVSSQSGGTLVSDEVAFTLPVAPLQLPAMSLLTHAAPSPGYVMLGILSPDPSSPKSAALIVDNNGQVVWHRTTDGPAIDFQPQPNGTFTLFSTIGSSPPHFFELTRGGTILREFTAAAPNETDPHELRLIGNEYYLFGEGYRTMDLTLLGGLAAATVRGLTVERGVGSSPLTVWSTFDHLQITDASPDIVITGANVNPWHGNAIEIDYDGSLLVSFRNSDTIIKMDPATGHILWRLGGNNSDFTFVNDPLDGFSHQHGIRRLPNGNVLLFDNGNLHTPPVSRAVEYALNESAKTATLVWEYRGSSDLFSAALGFAQRLPNGNTLICFGAARRVVEVDVQGTKQWELAIDEPGHFPYRAFRIDSLY